MQGYKKKIVLIAILMFIVIALIVALTLVVLDSVDSSSSSSKANSTPTVDVNLYPNISDECTFDLTISEYNALTGPGCKNGYSRYNLTDVTLGDSTLDVVIIYTDLDGNKAGIYVDDKRATTIVDDVTNIKFGIFDEKLFILDKNNGESNVFAYSVDSLQIYNLKETLSDLNITDTLTNAVVTSQTIDQDSFSFSASEFTFTVQISDDAGQVITGSTYRVTFSGEVFADPEVVSAS